MSIILQGLNSGLLITQGYGGIIIIPPVIEPVVEPATHYKTIFRAVKALNINTLVSGFQLEETSLPYISFQKLGNYHVGNNSLLQRFESSKYKFCLYTETFDDLLDQVKEIQEQFDFITFNLELPRTFLNWSYLGRNFNEVWPGVWEGQIFYECLIQKDISRNNLQKIYRGINFANAIKLRYNQLINVYNFVVDWPNENILTERPYVFIDDFNEFLDHWTSKSKLSSNSFKFNIFADQLDEVEEIQDQICDVFDYCKMIFDDQHTVFEWQEDTCIELEVGTWHGTISYNLLSEKVI